MSLTQSVAVVETAADERVQELKSVFVYSLFNIPPLVSLLPPGLPPRTFACTVSSLLLGF